MHSVNPAVDWLRRTVLPSAHMTTDSRSVTPGDVFCAYRGAVHDGREYIGTAIAQGAAAVLWDPEQNFRWRPEWRIPERSETALKQACGSIAAGWYDMPSRRLSVTGVTGTSGKSSSALWIAQASEALGKRSAFIGTLGAGRLSKLGQTGHTTPDPVLLQRLLADFVREEVDVVAMEVSSIGLEEGRVAGTHFEVAVFTNLSHDHLDYHGTLSNYERAKSRLFAWTDLKHAVVNLDDPAGRRMASIAQTAGARLWGFGLNAAHDLTLRATDVKTGGNGMEFELAGPFGTRHFDTSLIGSFNVPNLLGVMGTLLALNFEIDPILVALRRLKAPPGRLERVQVDDPEAAPMVLVDYAHKPDALEKALHACRALAVARGGRLSVIFGCGGDRDVGKRPLMGAIASRLADHAIVTNDNPRSEDPNDIALAVMRGALPDRPLDLVPDRRQAIQRAVGAAGPSDVILIAGKGHETYQEIGGQKQPFSDVEEASVALQVSGWRQTC